MILAFLSMTLLADPLGPGRYCAYDAADLVSPPGDVITIVDVGPGTRPHVSVSVQWPHSDKVFKLGGTATADAAGNLRFPAEDGWGNRPIVILSATGELGYDLAPHPDSWAASVTYFYSGATLGACRPDDIPV
jgi:hypothetical protein